MSTSTRLAVYRQALIVVSEYTRRPDKDKASANALYIYEHARHVISQYEEEEPNEMARRGMLPQSAGLGIS